MQLQCIKWRQEPRMKWTAKQCYELIMLSEGTKGNNNQNAKQYCPGEVSSMPMMMFTIHNFYKLFWYTAFADRLTLFTYSVDKHFKQQFQNWQSTYAISWQSEKNLPNSWKLETHLPRMAEISRNIVNDGRKLTWFHGKLRKTNPIYECFDYTYSMKAGIPSDIINNSMRFKSYLQQWQKFT